MSKNVVSVEGDDGLHDNLVSIDQLLPKQIHILPIHGNPIFPGIITPVAIHSQKIIETIKNMKNPLDYIGLVLVKDEEQESISSDSLYKVGTVAKILKQINLPNGSINLLVNSLKRFSINKIVSEDDNKIIATVDYINDSPKDEDSIEVKALSRAILSQLRILAEQNPFLMEQIKLTLANIDEPSKIADFAVTILKIKKEEYQNVLEEFNIEKRLNMVLRFLDKEVKLAELQKNIQNQIDKEIDKKQREFFLREQLKAIKTELGLDDDPHNKDIKAFAKKMNSLKFPPSVKEQVKKELDKFSSLDNYSSEYVVSKNYLDTIFALPWGKFTKDSHDLKKSKQVLNSQHFGLEDVKERILEFLAVRKLNPKKTGGSIICLLGPPGVGKTSLGKSIAKSLKREFYRFSLGGMRDEAEIKGHRRTYVGAMPGKILLALKVVQSSNPVIMLDEIDKVGTSYQGDPASALLEVLDPEQNVNFIDHYLDLPFDLSGILFVTTANTLDTIPRALLDRMEVIHISGYIEEEKYEIAKRYLFPKQIDKNGISKSGIKISKKTFQFIINHYARDSGVRNLERAIEGICRKTASKVASDENYDKVISSEIARKYLGPERFMDEQFDSKRHYGVVNGLAWTSFGGSVLHIEAISIRSTRGDFKLTGQLGDVMVESANIAYSYIKKIAYGFNVESVYFDQNMIHLHVPAGATPKDGPSAGITMASGLLSLILKQTISSSIGMTGELTLTGHVLPIGGLKDKVIAAKRSKLKNIIFPKQNKKDLDEIPDYVKKGLNFHIVEHFDEVIQIIFPKLSV